MTTTIIRMTRIIVKIRITAIRMIIRTIIMIIFMLFTVSVFRVRRVLISRAG